MFLSASLALAVSLCLSLCLSVSVSLYLSLCISVSVSLSLCICLSVSDADCCWVKLRRLEGVTSSGRGGEGGAPASTTGVCCLLLSVVVCCLKEGEGFGLNNGCLLSVAVCCRLLLSVSGSQASRRGARLRSAAGPLTPSVTPPPPRARADARGGYAAGRRCDRHRVSLESGRRAAWQARGRCLRFEGAHSPRPV